MTLADGLTYSRLLLGPVIFFLLLHGSSPALWVALVLTVVGELTDFLDGWVARRANTVSDVGKVADPFTDGTTLAEVLRENGYASVGVSANWVASRKQNMQQGFHAFISMKRVNMFTGATRSLR